MVLSKELLSIFLLYSVVTIFAFIAILSICYLLKKLQPWPYKQVPIMSEVERKFYRQLLATFPQYHVFVQVQLSRIIRPPKGKDELIWLNKIWRLSLDYVILDCELKLVAAIELDDASHRLPKRREADQRKDKALKAAGVHLIRIKTNKLPSKQELLALLAR